MLAIAYGFAHVGGCGCDDIGCNDVVVMSASAEHGIARVELQTPDGWVNCSASTQTSCSVATNSDGTVEFTFRAEPRETVHVRIHNAADDLLFDGPVSLSVSKTDPDGAECPAECSVGTGTLPER